MLEMIFASFIVGFLVAVPPGTVTVIAAQKSILYGFRNSLLFIFGSCISDVFYILVVFFGISPLFENNTLLKIVFWYFSSILLLYFGYDAFRSFKERTDFSYTQADHKSMLNNIISGIVVTLSNPMTIAGWIVIAGGFFTHWSREWPSIHQYGTLSILFIMVGVLSWFVPLLYIVAKARSIFNHNVIKGFLLLSGLFFICIGLFSGISATSLLLNKV